MVMICCCLRAFLALGEAVDEFAAVALFVDRKRKMINPDLKKA
jgi:hypothetical protein